MIEQLLADPRRIVQVRAQLHIGQRVRYLSWHDGKLHSARVVAMHGGHVALHDAAYSKAFKVHYAALLTEPTDAPIESGPPSADVELTRPSPPPEAAGRSDFRVGSRSASTTQPNSQPRGRCSTA